MKYTTQILSINNQIEWQIKEEPALAINEVSINEYEHDEEALLEECSLSYDNLSLGHYNSSIDAIPCLTFEEEVRYARMVCAAKVLNQQDQSSNAQDIKQKAQIARQVLIEHNLRLVRSVARKYEGRGVLLDDLIQEGNIGLIEAVDKYNPEYGFRFSTYAVHTIRQKIRRFTQDQGRDIRLPINLQDKIAKIKSTQTFLLQYLQREATTIEVAISIALGRPFTIEVISAGKKLTDFQYEVNYGEYKPEGIVDALNVNKSVVRMDIPISEDNDHEWIETISTQIKEGLCDQDRDILRSILKQLLTILDQREIIILAYRYGLGGAKERTYEDIGKIIGLTRERTRQLEKEALETLRACKDSYLLLSFQG